MQLHLFPKTKCTACLLQAVILKVKRTAHRRVKLWLACGHYVYKEAEYPFTRLKVGEVGIPLFNFQPCQGWCDACWAGLGHFSGLCDQKDEIVFRSGQEGKMKKELILRKTDSLQQRRSVDSLASALRQQKQEIKALERTALLLDVSGSMAEPVGERPKIHQLAQVVNSPEFHKARKVIFSGFVKEVPTVGTRTFTNTDLAGALRFCGSLVPLPETLIIVSDGLPDSPERALKEAQALVERGIQINTIYIGPGGDQGDQFMQMLASLSGGRSATVDTSKQLLPFAGELKKNLLLLTGGR